MASKNPLTAYKMLTAALAERRSKPRVNCSYPATVRGRELNGERFEVRAVLASMSASGMYLRFRRPVQRGDKLFVVVRLATVPLEQTDAPRIAAYGQVVRIEPTPDGTYGVALKLLQHRFL